MNFAIRTHGFGWHMTHAAITLTFALSLLTSGVAAAVPVGIMPSVGSRSNLPIVTAPPLHPVVGYFNATGEGERMDRLPWKYVTHVNVAFAGINSDGACAWMNTSGNGQPDNSGKTPAIIKQLVAARNQYNPKTKLILSVGGWTMSNRFSQVTRTQSGREKLAQSCVDMVQQLGLDGLDYDWEYPTKLGNPNCAAGQTCQSKDDPTNFSALLVASRDLLGADLQEAPLSVALYMTPGSRGIPYDVAGMDTALTYYNIMAYDAAAPNWSPGTAFHSPIGASEQALDAYKAAGASPRKLNLGVPMYAYVWNNVPTPGLGVAAPGNATNSTQYYTSDLLKRYQSDLGCKAYDDRDGTFFYCATGTNAGQWCAIDTAAVLFAKASYVHANQYGGVMIWSIQGDSELGDRTHSIYAALNP